MLTDPSLSEFAVPVDGDPYEGYPEDDDAHDTQNPAVALEAARVLQELCATRWKAGAALSRRACRRVMRAGAPAVFAHEFAALRVPLMLNSDPHSYKGTWRPFGAQSDEKRVEAAKTQRLGSRHVMFIIDRRGL